MAGVARIIRSGRGAILRRFESVPAFGSALLFLYCLTLSFVFLRHKGFYSLIEYVRGSHQASFLPGEEELFVMNHSSQRPFERVPGPDLVFDLCGWHYFLSLSHISRKYISAARLTYILLNALRLLFRRPPRRAEYALGVAERGSLYP